jgi:ABC-2 type transport system ATP-binding protein
MIRFEKVTKRFRRQTVLKGIDLEIERGHRVALVGSNGAGKTTLIRCLLGEYTCEGRVVVDGMDPRVHRSEVLSKVGFVPQLPPPLKMPIGQLVRYAASLCDADPQRMGAVAGRLGLELERHRHQPFVKLSGGQKQKLLIAIALGRDSELLVMDEPAANLDPEARHIFFQLLAEKRDSAAMLISSHRLDEVAALVNRVIEMDRGDLVLDDRVADLVDLSSRLFCRLSLVRAEEAFARTIGEWGFQGSDGGLVWTGLVPGPDRLRFLGVLSRYAALLGSIRMEEAQGDGVSVSKMQQGGEAR